MQTYTVRCVYPVWYAATTTVQAETPEGACERAVIELNQAAYPWEAVNDPGPTFVDALAKGDLDDPEDGERLPVPRGYREVDELGTSKQAGAPEMYAVLSRCNDAFAAWQCGQIPGRPEDILALVSAVRDALALADGKS